LWFKEDKSAPEFINDFNVIYDFRSFAFDMNAESHKYLLNNVNEQDIVITHHLPTKKSISARWLNYNNYGFVHDADQIITENKPKIWIHGHTHDSKDYMYGETRILCNPYGYHKYEQNKDYQSLILEI
jgi:Icc-related predicted phosphoesterase